MAVGGELVTCANMTFVLVISLHCLKIIGQRPGFMSVEDMLGAREDVVAALVAVLYS